MYVCVCVPVEARVGIRYLETGATGSYELPDIGVQALGRIAMSSKPAQSTDKTL